MKNILVLIPFYSDQETIFEKFTELGSKTEFELEHARLQRLSFLDTLFFIASLSLLTWFLL